MYKLEYLPVAQRDMVEIVRYISGEFNVLLGGRRKEVGDSRSCSVC